MRNIFFILFCLLFYCKPKDRDQKTELPDIIYILADDLGYGDVSVYNTNSKISTPNIDRFASQGMRFTDAHSPSSVCTPTRYGILTGRYCWRSRLPKGVLLGYGQSLIEKPETTVAEVLQRKGYNTAVVGKWHLGVDWPVKDSKKDSLEYLMQNTKTNLLTNINSEWIDFTRPPINGPRTHGFDYSYILPASLDMAPYCYLENDTLTSLPDAYTPGSNLNAGYTGAFWREGRMSESFDFYEVLPNFIDKGKAFVNRQRSKGQPFFLYLALAAPHTPWMPKDDYSGKSGAGQYGDFVQMVDAAIGDFLENLDKQGLAENTLVVITSDNGPYWKPEFIEKFDHHAAYNYRGMKADIWEGGHRIPFMVRWPGQVKPNSQSRQLTTLTNLMATVSEVIGVELSVSEGMDSQSILSVLQGGEANNEFPVVHHSSNGVFAVRKGGWKFIEQLGSGGFSQPTYVEPETDGLSGQLYNLVDDPGELNNLFLSNPDKVVEMKNILDELKRGE